MTWNLSEEIKIEYMRHLFHMSQRTTNADFVPQPLEPVS